MSLLDALARPATDVASLVSALLSDPRRPDPSHLPEPPKDDVPVPEATMSEPEPASTTPTSAMLSGPSGLGTSALRPPAVGTSVDAPADVAAAASSWLRPNGLGTSASRLTEDRPQADAEESSMPELFCPGPVRDDPALGEVVNDQVVAWAEQVGIYAGRLDRLRAANFGRLMMLTHPATNDPDRLLAATKCVVAEWAVDDYFVDEVELGADPAVLATRLMKLYAAVIDPADLPVRYQPQLDHFGREEPTARAFRSAMEHLARYASVTQMARFQHQMAFMFVAWDHGADWHRNERTPPVWEYLVQRHYDSYLPPMILIDSVAGYELPPNEFYDRRVRRAFKMAGAANVLLNDLHSEGFETEHDYNLPRVIAAEDGCSHEEAIRRTVEIHNELMHTFVAEASALSLVGSPWLRRFFLDTWAWLGGSREWHASTRKYKHGDDD
jgi:2-methylisoborneol synthase